MGDELPGSLSCPLHRGSTFTLQDEHFLDLTLTYLFPSPFSLSSPSPSFSLLSSSPPFPLSPLLSAFLMLLWACSGVRSTLLSIRIGPFPFSVSCVLWICLRLHPALAQGVLSALVAAWECSLPFCLLDRGFFSELRWLPCDVCSDRRYNRASVGFVSL